MVLAGGIAIVRLGLRDSSALLRRLPLPALVLIWVVGAIATLRGLSEFGLSLVEHDIGLVRLHAAAPAAGAGRRRPRALRGALRDARRLRFLGIGTFLVAYTADQISGERRTRSSLSRARPPASTCRSRWPGSPPGSSTGCRPRGGWSRWPRSALVLMGLTAPAQRLDDRHRVARRRSSCSRRAAGVSAAAVWRSPSPLSLAAVDRRPDRPRRGGAGRIHGDVHTPERPVIPRRSTSAARRHAAARTSRPPRTRAAPSSPKRSPGSPTPTATRARTSAGGSPTGRS